MLNISINKLAGLDVGLSSVKMIKMRKGKAGLEADAAAIAQIHLSASNAARPNISEEVDAIQNCVRSVGGQIQTVVSRVSDPEVIVRSFRLPNLPQNEIPGAVELEAAQISPFAAEDTTVDYQVISADSQGISGILVIAKNKTIDSRLQAVKNASLNCASMDIDGFALLNCFREYQKYESRNKTDKKLVSAGHDAHSSFAPAILNVENSSANLVIASNHGLPLIRDISFNSDAFIRRFAQQNSLSKQQICSLLFEENSDQNQVNLSDALKKPCQRLAADITSTFRYYQSIEKNALIDKIYVCGDFAGCRGFVQLLAAEIGIDCQLWNPFTVIPCNSNPKCKEMLTEKGHTFAIAAGLAMKSFRPDSLGIDLLKGKGCQIRNKAETISIAVLALALPLLTLLVIGGFYLKNKIEMSIKTSEIASFESKLERMSDFMELHKSLIEQKSEINIALADVASLLDRHMQWTPSLVVLSKDLPHFMALTELELEERFVKTKTPMISDPEKLVLIDVPVRKLRMNINASPDYDCDAGVKSFMDVLNSHMQSELRFSDIQVSRDFDAVKGKEVVSYKMDCNFKP